VVVETCHKHCDRVPLFLPRGRKFIRPVGRPNSRPASVVIDVPDVHQALIAMALGLKLRAVSVSNRPEPGLLEIGIHLHR
jgi:hypothetical protein